RFVLIRSQPSDLLVFLLVSCWYRENKRSRRLWLFRATFSTLSHHEEIKDAKAWDGDVVELQLAHLDNSTVEGLYKKHGPLALVGSRTKLMQHWADRIDRWLNPNRVMSIKRGTQA